MNFKQLLILMENSYLKSNVMIARDNINDFNKKCKGEFHCLYDKLRNYAEKFYEYARMSKNTFDACLPAPSRRGRVINLND